MAVPGKSGLLGGNSSVPVEFGVDRAEPVIDAPTHEGKAVLLQRIEEFLRPRPFSIHLDHDRAQCRIGDRRACPGENLVFVPVDVELQVMRRRQAEGRSKSIDRKADR